jgi:hypothetical protein
VESHGDAASGGAGEYQHADLYFRNEVLEPAVSAALSIQILREDAKTSTAATSCHVGDMDRFATACNSGGEAALASSHHWWMEQVSEADCVKWCSENEHCLWFEWEPRLGSVWTPGACHGRATSCDHIPARVQCDTLATDENQPISNAHADPCGETTSQVVCYVKSGYTARKCQCEDSTTQPGGTLASSHLGCFESYGWDATFSCDDGAEVFYYSCARLNPDPNNSMVERCEEICIANGYGKSNLLMPWRLLQSHTNFSSTVQVTDF